MDELFIEGRSLIDKDTNTIIDKQRIVDEIFENWIRIKYNILGKKLTYDDLIDTEEFNHFRKNNPCMAEMVVMFIKDLRKLGVKRDE